MFSQEVMDMLIKGIGETLYMTLGATIFGYVLGLPMGIIMVTTSKDGIRPNAGVYKVLDVIVNIGRSIPFLILLILLMPLTRCYRGGQIHGRINDADYYESYACGSKNFTDRWCDDHTGYCFGLLSDGRYHRRRRSW